MLKNKLEILQTWVIPVYGTALNIFPRWISKPCIWKHKNHCKARSSAERFSQNCCAWKSRFNVWNYKSGRHNQRYTFKCRKSQHKTTPTNIPYICKPQHKTTSTNIPYICLKVKRRKKSKTKNPSSHRRNCIFRGINLCQDATLCESTKKTSFLNFNETNLCNNHILKDSECIHRFCINFLCHCVLNQVDLDMNLLDNAILTKVVLRPTKRIRSVGPTQIKIKENNKQKEITPRKQKIQEYEYTTMWRICRSK